MHQVFDTRIFKKECVSLAKDGFKVTLIAPHDKEEVVQGVHIVPVVKQQNFRQRIWSAPKDAVRLAQEINADLYHFHDPELVPFMAGFAKKYKAKVIWDAHENYKDTIRSFNSLKIKPVSIMGAHWFNGMELRNAKKHFAGVVTITDKMAEKYLAKQIDTCVLANYADTTAVHYSGGDVAVEAPTLISSGAHFEARAIREIAQSLPMIRAEVPEARIIFSGKFVDSQLEEEVRSILNNADNTQGHWTMEGEVTFDYLVNEAIPKAWAGLVLFDISDPNNRNGLPNRFFELWSNGVPVIATDHTQVAKMVKAHNGGIVIPSNEPKEISKAFTKIAADRELRNELGNNGYQAIVKQFSWQTNFKDLLSFYKKILSE